jgi:hypothetical protein
MRSCKSMDTSSDYVAAGVKDASDSVQPPYVLQDGGESYNFCSIITSDYADRILSLALSLKDNCAVTPNVRVCCVDEDGFSAVQRLRLEYVQPFRVSDISDARTQKILGKYKRTALCCALKPLVLKHLAELGVEKNVYLDSDMCCFSNPDSIFKGELLESGIVLTPQRYESKSLESRYGVFNAGFIGFNGGGRSTTFLDWWADKNLEACEIRRGVFLYDQKYLDEAPRLFDFVKPTKEIGYNAGPWYWTINTGRYDIDADKKTINGSRLIFYHYSGLEIPSDFKVYNKFGDSSILIAAQWPVYRTHLSYVLTARRILGWPAHQARIQEPGWLKQHYWQAVKCLYARIYEY